MTVRRLARAEIQILNVIVKQAMRETGMKQFGHRPRFFNHMSPIDVQSPGDAESPTKKSVFC